MVGTLGVVLWTGLRFPLSWLQHWLDMKKLRAKAELDNTLAADKSVLDLEREVAVVAAKSKLDLYREVAVAAPSVTAAPAAPTPVATPIARVTPSYASSTRASEARAMVPARGAGTAGRGGKEREGGERAKRGGG
ncbi:hypothetical protein ARSEF4850_009580 [Beauveria asiatica]